MTKKQKLAAALALSLLATSPAWSAGTPSQAPSPTVSDTSPSAPATRASRVAALFGSPADLRATTRTVTLAPGMNYVNVASGESVAFNAGGRSAGWTFLEAAGGTSFDMALILPDLPQARGIRVYVGASDVFHGG
ncbi:CzcE family metal-binding protein [Cupriavidus basilensis]|uniref:CzcE family metal-binding protein n=1 Tax=Cupriavidus basilensis TaxID=68895 RepID=UPI000751164E|nr:CzcE family metal-binding protein [Cupriavidus basilensis]